MDNKEGMVVVAGSIDALDAHETREAAIDAMIKQIVAQTLEVVKVTKIDGWQVSIVSPGANKHDVGQMMVAMVTIDCEMVYGPIAFPVDWGIALRDTIDGVVKDINARAMANMPVANGRPA